MDLHRFEDNPAIFFDSNPHITDFFEIMIFQKANGTIELNGQPIVISENSFFFVCPFQRKSCAIALTGIQGFHLVFQNDFLSEFFDDKLFAYRLQYFYNSQYPQHLQVHPDDYKVVQLVLDEIIAEIENYQSDSDHIIRSLLYFALSKLNRLYSKYYSISPDLLSNSMIYRFKELLEKHIRSKHHVDQYCDLLHVNRHKLNSTLKMHTGCTSKELINIRLLQEVKAELRYSNKTIKEIAHELNFSESNNLTRFFQNMEGVTPSTYRATYQNDSFL